MAQNDELFSSFDYESPLKKRICPVSMLFSAATTGTHRVPIQHEATALVADYPELM
jgi:hypothetical protein